MGVCIRINVSFDEFLKRISRLESERESEGFLYAGHIIVRRSGNKIVVYKKKDFQKNPFFPVFAGKAMKYEDMTNVKGCFRIPIIGIISLLISLVFLFYASLSIMSPFVLIFCIPILLFALLGYAIRASDRGDILRFLRSLDDIKQS